MKILKPWQPKQHCFLHPWRKAVNKVRNEAGIDQMVREHLETFVTVELTSQIRQQIMKKAGGLMDAEGKRNVELRKEQERINQELAAANERLIQVIRAAQVLGAEPWKRFANAILTQFNKRTGAYTAAVQGIADTFEEILNDARKSTGSQEGDVI